MKVAPGTPLEVTLHWDTDDIQLVGRLAYRDHVAYLEYDEKFLISDLELSPVHHTVRPGLDRPQKADVFEGLHGMFNDSLPDGWGRLLVDRRARQLDIEPATLTPLDRLACVGTNGIGALCYAPVTDIWATDENILDLDKLAADALLVLQGDVSKVISTLGQAGGSPGGARPKALIAISDKGHAVHGAGGVTNGCTDDYIHYLVKFPGQGDPDDIASIEMAYAEMAKESGVLMPETELLSGESGRFYFAAHRFDRQGTQRTHVHSASGLLYADIRIPALDYKDLIQLTRAVTRDQRECKAMFTLAVFNVLSHNRDDHARQFSYLMERDGVWRLAPAYDLTWSMGPGGEHSTSILGHGKNITREHLIELGKNADMKRQEILEVIERVRDAVNSWNAFADEYGVSNHSAKMIANSLASIKL